MFKRFAAMLLVVLLFTSSASAETLSQFFFKTTSSWTVVEGQPSLIVSVNPIRNGLRAYEADVRIKERGGAEAYIDRIMVHIFDDDYRLF
ncbi:MAG: hypothetical protein IJT96_07875 [Lachnospiraceae bacterium]|nr:hypothetical protein [Lachnospiraceae bacterium]